MAVLLVGDVKSMKLRKLRKEEHIRTRELWEQIFTEDSKEFLDYYYTVKTKDNEIYVIEDAEKIISMIHLNPFQMRVNDKICQTHYIVAVATDEKYRRQGLMAKLLNYVLQLMKDRGEPFTFLMPASEAIYRPFGFEFIYEQIQGNVFGKKVQDNVEFLEANEIDCENIAEYANGKLKEYDVVTVRDAAYYRMILKEQQSEKGGILIAKKQQDIVGVFCYAREKELELREPIFDQTSILEHAVWYLCGEKDGNAICYGYGENAKPMIMAKVLNPQDGIDLKNGKVFLNEVV